MFSTVLEYENGRQATFIVCYNQDCLKISIWNLSPGKNDVDREAGQHASPASFICACSLCGHDHLHISRLHWDESSRSDRRKEQRISYRKPLSFNAEIFSHPYLVSVLGIPLKGKSLPKPPHNIPDFGCTMEGVASSDHGGGFWMLYVGTNLPFWALKRQADNILPNDLQGWKMGKISLNLICTRWTRSDKLLEGMPKAARDARMFESKLWGQHAFSEQAAQSLSSFTLLASLFVKRYHLKMRITVKFSAPLTR